MNIVRMDHYFLLKFVLSMMIPFCDFLNFFIFIFFTLLAAVLRKKLRKARSMLFPMFQKKIPHKKISFKKTFKEIK
jgi:hypothetical protein